MHNEYDSKEFNDIPVPENIDWVINKGVQKAVKLKKAQRRKHIAAACISTAAAAATFSLFCVSNPALAAKLPLIGHIFEKTENAVSYKGDYSSVAQTLVDETETRAQVGADGSSENEASAGQSAYVQTANGLTVTISEAYYNNKALYLAVNIENEEEFPADFIRTQNMEDYNWDYDTLQLLGNGKFSFTDIDALSEPYIEGKFVDSHTFAGIYRIDLAHLTYQPSPEEIAAKGISFDDSKSADEMSNEEFTKADDEYYAKVKEAFPETGNPIAIPDAFTLDISINSIGGELFETRESQSHLPDGEPVTISDSLRKTYEGGGTWDFCLDVTFDASKTQTVEVNNTNEQGLGISKIEKTPYELTADLIYPEGKSPNDYFLVMCDKNGDLLDYQGSFADTYQVYDRDTSTVDVYICDYVEYMDEIKGYYWSSDYEENRKTKTFKQYLDERALYHTEANFS